LSVAAVVPGVAVVSVPGAAIASATIAGAPIAGDTVRVATSASDAALLMRAVDSRHHPALKSATGARCHKLSVGQTAPSLIESATKPAKPDGT
jgi:hypothetical protein